LKRLFLLAILIPLSLPAYQYEPVLLKTQAKLLPRLLLMSQGVTYAAPNRFTICIVREPEDGRIATVFKNTLLGYYPNGWQYHSMQIVESGFDTMEQTCKDSEVLYLLKSGEPNIRRAVTFATAHQKLTISYANGDLDYGVLISLYAGRDMRPLLNLAQAKKAKIHFDSDLKRISKFMQRGPVQ
jgi:hypothetical protein